MNGSNQNISMQIQTLQDHEESSQMLNNKGKYATVDNNDKLSILFQDEQSENSENPMPEQSNSLVQEYNLYQINREKSGEKSLTNCQGLLQSQLFLNRNSNANRYNQNESDDYCTLGNDSYSQSLISYKNQNSPGSPQFQNASQMDKKNDRQSITQNNLRNQFMQLEIDDKENNPYEDNSAYSKQNQNRGLNTSKAKEIKSQWIDQTTSAQSCFLTGRGSTYGTQSHITVHSAMDQVILKHHKAAQKQYLKMKSLKGPVNQNSRKELHGQTNQANQETSQTLGSSQLIQNENLTYQEIYNQRKKSVQHASSIHPVKHQRTNSQNNDQPQIQKKKAEVSMTTKNSTLPDQKVFVFPNNTINSRLDEEDHFKETFNTIHQIVQGINNRKSSFGGISNVSAISQGKRTTETQPFPLSRSNSRRTKDVLKCQINNEMKQNQQFKAKRAPGNNPPKFIALKSTKALTIPQEFNLKTDQREVSKMREQSIGGITQNTQMQERVSSLKNLVPKSEAYNSFDSNSNYTLTQSQRPPSSQQQHQSVIQHQKQQSSITLNHCRNSSSNLNSKNTSKMHQNSTMTSSGAGCDVNLNKYLKGNIKKMKIGQNYAQLVNYAKAKFVQ
ncbi:UNKNOWN [Stylonychia lemnae]|uniref:Uncharacterized protein n=1 Tax=Stylonychia lemnae TaxID=5949 RepID=A0A078B2Y6_STYLE|nr:UNKNOWN [Stylonychia lemnae]|eukprot:CDW88829.1 UNKNOWN [Stylonychia lemnae]